MRIVDVGPETGSDLDSYGTTGAVLARFAVAFVEAHLNVIHLDTDGRIGRHPAGTPQLLLVMSGEGTVAGANGSRVPIRAGQAALWEPGEDHDTHADTPMSVLIIEAAQLQVGDETLTIPDDDGPSRER
ncbi:MAG: cupin domain-containing protein [Actinobacteria bacterium]|nr:cupin domain-containing protein [Actinomycetota bacterium]